MSRQQYLTGVVVLTVGNVFVCTAWIINYLAGDGWLFLASAATLTLLTAAHCLGSWSSMQSREMYRRLSEAAEERRDYFLHMLRLHDQPPCKSGWTYFRGTRRAAYKLQKARMAEYHELARRVRERKREMVTRG